MALYRISGVWKNKKNEVTHYALHTEEGDSISRAKKVKKEEAIKLLENPDNGATTWVWNYEESHWYIGDRVRIEEGVKGKNLISTSSKGEKISLDNLIDYDWINKKISIPTPVINLAKLLLPS